MNTQCKPGSLYTGSPDHRDMTDVQPVPTAQNVHHVGLTVPDLAEAVAFFESALGCELLYRKGPFGDSDDRSMERRLEVHPDATASLAMLRCGPSMNLELFEWDAPNQDESQPKLDDIGALHLALHVADIDQAVAALTDRDDVTMLDGPHTNDDGPTAGLSYIYCRTTWGLYLELLEPPERMPYADKADERLYDPAKGWEYRPEIGE